MIRSWKWKEPDGIVASESRERRRVELYLPSMAQGGTLKKTGWGLNEPSP